MNINKTTIDEVLDISDEEVLVEDDESEVNNSFFENRYHGVKVLILAPHSDDEINIAGNMIINLSKARAEIFVAYSTNSDFDIDASIRAEEAVNSLSILGVKRDHIIFLGYGDTYNGKGNPHIFSALEPMTSPAGKIETYPAGDFNDYSFTKRGRHSKYTRQNYLQDLKDLILDLKADIIFCVDFDKHADHRMLSLMFEQVMYEILSRADNDYNPEIYKRFAYSTAFTAIRDFYNENLLETKRPVIGNIESYDFDIIDRANYAWNNRVRFPVSENCRETLLENNPIARAVFCHRSQHNNKNALGIINSDEVYFERRNDNLIFGAEVEASSGDVSKVRDFHFINTDDIDAAPPRFADYLWQPESSDKDKCLTVKWKQLQQIEQVKIYGSIDENSGIDKLEIKFDNTYTTVIQLPIKGTPYELNFLDKIFACQVEFRIIETHGQNFGISEIEFFANRESLRVIKPFIKITADDNFIYEYFIPRKVSRIKIDIYRFHIDKPVEVTAIGGSIERDENNKFILYPNNDNVTVRAEITDEPGIFDQIKIHRVSQFYFWQLKLKQLFERIRKF